MSMKNGERESTYTAFIKPFQNSRRRLTVLTYSEVEQVILELRLKKFMAVFFIPTIK